MNKVVLIMSTLKLTLTQLTGARPHTKCYSGGLRFEPRHSGLEPILNPFALISEQTCNMRLDEAPAGAPEIGQEVNMCAGDQGHRV